MYLSVILSLAIEAYGLGGGASLRSPQFSVPVMVGTEEPDFDACGGVGEVVRLKADGDNFLSVRAGPSRSAAEIYRLKKGHLVNLCDVSADTQWLGIVFQNTENEADYSTCGVGTPLPRQPYTGVCLQGWVSARYIDLVAG